MQKSPDQTCLKHGLAGGETFCRKRKTRKTLEACIEALALGWRRAVLLQKYFKG
jgi:hypothetical protein